MAAAQQPERSEDDKLQSAFKAFLEEEFRRRPLDATRAGNHDFDHLLDDVSPKARAESKERWRAMLERLPKLIDRAKLTRSGQIDLEIWQHALTRDLWLAENTRVFEEDPRVYNDYITESTYLLLTQSTLPRAVNIKNAAQRMAQIPRIVEAAKSSLKNPPRVLVETAIRQNKGAIAYYEKAIYEIAGETAALSELKPAADKIVPVLRAYQRFLEDDLLPRAKGEWRLGKKKFAEKMILELDAGITADEVLKEAEAEADRVEAEMAVIARQLWSRTFPDKTCPVDTPDGKRAMIRQVLDHYSKEHGTTDKLVDDARATAESAKDFIKRKKILSLPEPDRCRIVEMPEFQRGNSVAYLNPAPPLDARAESYYAISPPPRDWDAERVQSFMREYNGRMLHILTIHEAYPGHYVQLEYSNRHPSLIRKVLWSGVFAEGWAVYTEQMMLDEGYGGGDLVMRLMQLKWYLRAVCNAILDHKMHAGAMTDEEAMYLLVVRAFQSEGEAILKVIRAKQSSCQLSTYFVGRMAFQRLRRQVQTERGEEFQLGAFHEAVLAHGTLPVKYLPELVRRPR
jgi:uncharacterized protein (DUF885 family)